MKVRRYFIIPAAIVLLAAIGCAPSHETNIQACVQNVNTLIVGIAYSCAIKEAVTFYATDPEGAIALCTKYSSAMKGLDKQICKLQIEEEMQK